MFVVSSRAMSFYYRLCPAHFPAVSISVSLGGSGAGEAQFLPGAGGAAVGPRKRETGRPQWSSIPGLLHWAVAFSEKCPEALAPRVAHNSALPSQPSPSMGLLQEGDPFQGLRMGLLSNTWK